MGHVKRIRLLLLTFARAGLGLSLLAGCGYQFVGNSSLLPKDAKTIYIESFVNRSRDVGTEKELTSALRGEFYRRGQLKVVDRLDDADVIVSGVVRSWDNTVASVNRKDEVLQYESALNLDVTLRRREPDEILWRGQGIRLSDVHGGSRAAVVTTSSDFRAGTLNASDVRRMTDVQLTEFERKEMRDRLMERFAKELHQRIMEMF
jgi:outer membrane lipopolysaccharide assembly protein LptE/RlpB